MSGQAHSGGSACNNVIALLPSYSHGLLSTKEYQAVTTHLAVCSFCKKRLAQSARFDAILRDQQAEVGREAPTTQWLLKAIGLVPQHRFDANMNLKKDYSTVTTPSSNTLSRAKRRTSSGIAAVGAFLLVALFAVVFTNFHSFAGLGGAFKGGHGTGASTISQPEQLYITNISMDSPTDGWAIGRHSSVVPLGGIPHETPALFHFTKNVWQPIATPNVGHDYQLYSLLMTSATDGWASGNNVILHFDGTSWKSFGAASFADQKFIFANAFGPNDVWAYGPTSLWHFDGSTWTEQSVPDFTGMGIDSMNMISPQEGWLLANPVSSADDPSKIIHYRSGVWQSQPISPFLHYDSMAVGTDGTGWAISLKGDNVTQGNPVLIRLQSGAWKGVNEPIGQKQHFAFASLYVADHMGTWLLLKSGPNPNQIWHFDGTNWLQVQKTGLPQDWDSEHGMQNGFVDGTGGFWVVGVGGTEVGTGRLHGLIMHFTQNTWEHWIL